MAATVLPSNRKGYFICPLTDFGFSSMYNDPKGHLGIDFATRNRKNHYIPCYPAQYGVVVDTFTVNACPAGGNTVVVQHNYADGTHCWTAYMHLKTINCKVGDVMRPLSDDKPTQLGVRGSTGTASTGPHVHMYITACNTLAYNWNYISQGSSKTLCNFNPYPDHLFLTKKVTYNEISPYARKLKYIEDVKFVDYPQTVAEDITRDRCVVASTGHLCLRSGPGKSYSTYDDYCSNGRYNVLDYKDADGYTWLKIGEPFWIARLSYVTVTKGITYPTPVERNDKVSQCEVLMDTLLMRKSPAGESYDEYIPKGIYNILDKQQATMNGTDYLWYKVSESGDYQFWIASGGSRTQDLEVEQETIEKLKKRIEELAEVNVMLEDQLATANSQVALLTTEVTTAEANLKVANDKLESIKKIVN